MSRPLTLAIAAALAWLPSAARADGPTAGECHSVKIDFTPASDPFQPQIVAWVEDGSGNFIATAYITQQTGRYGLGNRPGRYDFNSGPQWPYGRRVNVFPVWAHRQPNTYPTVRYQIADGSHSCCDCGDTFPCGQGSSDPTYCPTSYTCEAQGTGSSATTACVWTGGSGCIENDLSHSRDISSQENHYCPPEMLQGSNVDAITCASLAFTDKGVFDTSTVSLYPPRADQGAATDEADSPSVAQYAAMNPFDAVTAATPPGNAPYEAIWSIPSSLPNGNYVMWVEVSEEFDQNATYSTTAYPGPNVPYSDYGEPYRGQPSIVWSVPFVLSGSDTTAYGSDYVGYGDITGTTGTLNPPDSTISTTVPGSGLNRLEVVTDGSGTQYRLEVLTHPETFTVLPNTPTQVSAAATSALAATLTFTEPASGGSGTGPIASYQIRVLADATITDANFSTATPISATVMPVGAGTVQTVPLTELLPLTPYSVGVRAVDVCGNVGPVAVASFTTPDRQNGEVDACFIATAAYGSVMANDVELLRRFRDLALRHSVLGELFVEGYYTFGPPVAGMVGQSELLRESARDALAPLVDRVRASEQGARP